MTNTLKASWLLLFICLSSFTQANTIQFDISQPSQAIGEQLGFIYDPDQYLTPTEALALIAEQNNNSQEFLNFVEAGKTIWFSANIQLRNSQAQLAFIELQNNKSPQIDFYLYKENQLIKSQQYPSQDKRQGHFYQKPNFEFELHPNETVTLLYRVKYATNGLRPVLWDKASYNTSLMLRIPLITTFLGILAGLAIYNLILFFSLKQNVFFCYFAYVSATLGWRFLFSDHSSAFLPANLNLWTLQAASTLVMIAILSAALFCYYFFEKNNIEPKAQMTLKGAMLLTTLCAFTSLFTTAQFDLVMIGLTTVIVAATCLWVAITAWYKGQSTAKYYIISWFPLVVAGIYTQLSLWHLVPNFDNRALLIDIAILLEAILLTLALSDKLKRAELEATYYSSFDPVTQLPNHNSVIASLAKYQEHTSFTLLLIDIQRIRLIQHTLGLNAGNQVLTILARRLNDWSQTQSQLLNFDSPHANKRKVGQLERGYMVLAYQGNLKNLDTIIGDIRLLIQQPIDYQSLHLECDSHIGVLFSDYYQDCHIENLIQNVSIAANIATSKQLPYILYSDEKNLFSERRLALMGELKKALHNQTELHLVLQPQIRLSDKQVHGAEALLRWRHKEHGLIAPSEFIPLAEEAGIITDISLWVIEEALQLNHLICNTNPDHVISVNISAQDLEQPNFVAKLTQLVNNSPVANHQLLLEVTESAMMNNPGDAHLALAQINQLGVKTSIDDFGTGYSSLSYLSLLPVNELKIDKRFVLDISAKTQNYTITETILNLSQNLGLQSVAEGIEDADALYTLRDLGCDYGQGYYISKPLSLPDYLNWLANHLARI
ncbi:hypothetical protein C2869_21615 [Saccharobesus litoralis]|uniref:EAL domain-containing protein n=1 Tax=Saccharobesus litoralis TaxID=2172099 RepID=A0A2S0VXB5_9ALTE|nr:EAL domain-containing protein [Saccharobesus litoralis]AWB68838.1 hypothetical protein C2869_21615 [Saccharobesus litoralis]